MMLPEHGDRPFDTGGPPVCRYADSIALINGGRGPS
jgi:hypothetical protein